jgi:ATP-binding protein involved in chromosome partitioning
MARQFGVPFLGALPIDPLLLQACEKGVAFVTATPDAPGVAPFLAVVAGLVAAVEGGGGGDGGSAAPPSV